MRRFYICALAMGLLAEGVAQAGPPVVEGAPPALDIQPSFITLSVADPEHGLAGTIEDRLGRAGLRFEARRSGEILRARIEDLQGQEVALYAEGEERTIPLNLADGSVAEWTLTTRLEVGGVGFDPQANSDLAESERLSALAASPAGRLLRQLALTLFRANGDPALTAERRALELPYQALQDYYPTSLGLVEVNDDFLVSPRSGFVVRSQPQDLVLSRNHGLAPASLHHDEPEPEEGFPDFGDEPGGTLSLRDDASQVGDCLGRCFGGCGSWEHTWVGTPTMTRDDNCPSCSCVQQCSPRKCGKYVWLTWSGNAVHTTCGRVTTASIIHDTCVRTVCPGQPASLCIPCHPLVPAAFLACITPGVGSNQCWSYVGPHQTSDRAFNAGHSDCCWRGWWAETCL